MKYFESKTATAKYRLNYLNSIYSFINNFQGQTDENGFPLFNYNNIKLIGKEHLSSEEDFVIFRMTFDIEGIRLTGLLFEKQKNLPLIVMQHGLLGTPEIMSNMYEDHDSSNYNDIVKRLLELNTNVFAPQLLLWSEEYYGIKYDRNEIDKIANKCGLSLIGIETFCLVSILNYFNNLKSYQFIDMFGMSFGGLYTYYVASYCDIPRHFVVFSYAIRSSMLSTLPDASTLEPIIVNTYNTKELFIILGDKDPVVDIGKTIVMANKFVNKDRLIFFDGNHEIIKDDNVLAKII